MCVELRDFWSGTEVMELRAFWCGTEGGVELRGFWCGTEVRIGCAGEVELCSVERLFS